MIIDLSKSKLFTTDPDIRFAKEYGVPQGVWIQLWKKYKLLEYSNGDLRDYLFIKYARNLSFTSVRRWIIKSEIYSISNPVLRKGAHIVNSNIFGDYEQEVMNEIVKQHKYGDSSTSKIIIL